MDKNRQTDKDKRAEETRKSNQHEGSGTENRGFASMPHEKVQEIARKGGEARAEQLGHEGLSELGQKGGRARSEQLGPEGMAELGRKGGSAPHQSRGRQGQAEGDQGEESGNKGQGSGKGFASMPRDKVQDAARKGGESSSRHTGDDRNNERDKSRDNTQREVGHGAHKR